MEDDFDISDAFQGRGGGSLERVEEAMALVETIREMFEQVPESAEEFASSCTERAENIGEYVQRIGNATDAQIRALQNMADGMKRWIR